MTDQSPDKLAHQPQLQMFNSTIISPRSKVKPKVSAFSAQGKIALHKYYISLIKDYDYSDKQTYNELFLDFGLASLVTSLENWITFKNKHMIA